MTAQSDNVGSAGSAGHIIEAQIGSSKNDHGLEKISIHPMSLACLTRRIPFDLGNHMLEHHKLEVVRLPIDTCSIDDRLDYAIMLSKLEIWPNAISGSTVFT